MRAKTTFSNLIFVTLGTEVQEQMFRSGGQSDVKPPVLSSRASFLLIYRPLKDSKNETTLPRSRFQPPGPVAWKPDILPLNH
ncbi:hypothetical protein TNCV_1983011 [Trichonephila clavipes]|nr:hypothetical protein TNCV_1983011 [Trichonephila clavipes]